ncbi:hypothetical protein MD484_g6710, partial [Candolleomyces efflorescens]
MDEALLEHKATIYARATFANYTLSVAIAGVHIFMAVYGLWIFLETPEHLRKGRNRYILASLIITSLWATGAALDISHYFQLLFQSTSGYDLLVLTSQTQDTWSPMLSFYWWVVIVPAAASLSGIVLFFVANVFIRFDISNAALRARLSSASTSLIVASNVLLTGLIAFRLIQARRTLAELLPSADTGPYTAVITLLIESALPLSMFGIVTAALLEGSGDELISVPDGRIVASSLFNALFFAFCSLSPHMIIFRVTTGRSFAKFPFARDGSISNSLHFAHEPAESTVLHSTLNREAGRTFDAERGNGGDGSETEKRGGKVEYIEKAY